MGMELYRTSSGVDLQAMEGSTWLTLDSWTNDTGQEQWVYPRIEFAGLDLGVAETINVMVRRDNDGAGAATIINIETFAREQIISGGAYGWASKMGLMVENGGRLAIRLKSSAIEEAGSTGVLIIIAPLEGVNVRTVGEVAPITSANIVDEWESQSQTDPTGFHVNLKEVDGESVTADELKSDQNWNGA